MGKNLKGKELGAGISQRKDGRYSARFVTSSGKRIEKYFPMLQDARKWLAEAKMNDESGSVGVSVGMTVDAWFEFWIVNIKDKTVRYNTARNYREIPITKANRDMLLELKERADAGRYVQDEFKEFVFINRKGMPTKNTTYDVHINKLTRKAQIQNFSMHTLRHTFATRCIEAGMRPKTLQQILGHSSINITMNLYVHVTDEENTKEMLKFEEYSINMA